MRPRHLDQGYAGVVGAGRRQPGKIGGFTALDLLFDGAHVLTREGAIGAMNAPSAAMGFEQWQCKIESGRTEPWVAWTSPHLAMSPHTDFLD